MAYICISDYLRFNIIIDLAKPKSGAPLLFCLFVCLFFCWQLLICENTLIQVDKKKKERKNKKKFLSSLRAEPDSSAYEATY